MKINLIQSINKDLNSNEMNITIEFSTKTDEIKNFIEYMDNYKVNPSRKIIVSKDYELLEIEVKDIILFYTNNKNNYCRTKTGEYKIKSKLYELEKMDLDFIRISKSCVINVNNAQSFDISESGKIVVKLTDKSQEIVSRRKIRDVMNYLDERSI